MCSGQFLLASGYLTHDACEAVPASYSPSAMCLSGIQSFGGRRSLFLVDVSEGNDDFSLASMGGAVFETVPSIAPLSSPRCVQEALGVSSFSFILLVLIVLHCCFLSLSTFLGWAFSPFVPPSSSSSPPAFLKLFLEMAKKNSCQNIRVPRVLSVIERELYGWVDDEIFTQPSVIEADAFPELRREMRLTADGAAEGDYVLEAAGPSDRLPFRVPVDRVHFLWVYSELFTRLGIRLPFTEFQREVLSRCRVAASQLHLNGWGFLRTFKRVCSHFGFHPSWRVFLYTYQLHAPPPGKGFMSFRAYQGRKLFDSLK
ncbi:hypothetical protein PIB30_094795 [Stylosanthes scabra]|uniref:Uncharacterized protein n=1 Tax=Stylosanthes scabra TaxID=79078 RepID=A0ABU6QWQ9_9FABA|nr:hypothetical protein [Stylosanthes scabra]